MNTTRSTTAIIPSCLPPGMVHDSTSVCSRDFPHKANRVLLCHYFLFLFLVFALLTRYAYKVDLLEYWLAAHALLFFMDVYASYNQVKMVGEDTP